MYRQTKDVPDRALPLARKIEPGGTKPGIDSRHERLLLLVTCVMKSHEAGQIDEIDRIEYEVCPGRNLHGIVDSYFLAPGFNLRIWVDRSQPHRQRIDFAAADICGGEILAVQVVRRDRVMVSKDQFLVPKPYRGFGENAAHSTAGDQH